MVNYKKESLEDEIARFDPYKAFTWVSAHHITEMLITLAVIMILSKLLKVDFSLGLGDRKKGINM